MSDPGPTVDLVVALEDDDQIVAPTVRRVRAEIAAYAAVPTELIEASLKRNLHRAAQTLLDGAVPARTEIWEAEHATLERLRAGVPIEDIMAGFRLSISCIQERLVELADERGVDGSEIVRLTRLLWQLGDVFSAQAAATYREQGVASELAEQRLRDELLLSALAGHLEGDALERALTALGLDRSAAYVPFCARPVDADAMATAQQALSAQFHGTVCRMVPSGGRLVGVLAWAPSPVDGLVVALGPATSPDGLHHGLDVARQVLAATAPGEDGVQSVDRLGWRAAVSSSSPLGELLAQRYLAPLEESRGSSAPLIEAVRTYLEHDRSIPRAASALHLHVNTVRYRLTRFEELTGRPLASTDTVIEMSWVLRTLQLPTS